MREIKNIAVGGACFLVKDKDLLNGVDSEIACWLKKRGI